MHPKKHKRITIKQFCFSVIKVLKSPQNSSKSTELLPILLILADDSQAANAGLVQMLGNYTNQKF
jgi:hypothetical protein